MSDERDTVPPPPPPGGGRPFLRRTISSAAVIDTRRLIAEKLRGSLHRSVDAGVDGAEASVDEAIMRFGLAKYQEGIRIGRESLGVLCPAYLAILMRNFEAAVNAPLHQQVPGPPWVTASELVEEIRSRGFQVSEDEIVESCRVARLDLRSPADDGA